MDIKITNNAEKVLTNLYNKDKLNYKRICNAIEEIESDPYHKKFEAVEKYPPYKRTRVGKYRICFKLENKSTILIARIRKRSNVYN